MVAWGQRANFEEQYSGPSLQGSYIAGVYYPDKTKVGWWKNGYPEYFAKVLNSIDWIGLDIKVNGVKIDLNTLKVSRFYRELDMKKGVLRRSFYVKVRGQKVKFSSERFYCLQNKDWCALRYTIEGRDLDVGIKSTINAQVYNSDSNHGDLFWRKFRAQHNDNTIAVSAKTKKTGFKVAGAISHEMTGQNIQVLKNSKKSQKSKASEHWRIQGKGDCSVSLAKYTAISSSLYHPRKRLIDHVSKDARKIKKIGFDVLKKEQAKAWSILWDDMDIRIKGDDAAQQGIRFNLFQLNQTYQGDDSRLNIGPKGFTGEKYGGSTYWDTEAYCLPFYLSTAPCGSSKKSAQIQT